MSDDRSEADKLDSQGEEPEAESGAGYGSHAPEPDDARDEKPDEVKDRAESRE